MRLSGLRNELIERRQGWIRRSSRRIDAILAGPENDFPLVFWSVFMVALICTAGWLDR